MQPTKFIFHRRFKHCSTYKKENSFDRHLETQKCLGLRNITILSDTFCLSV